MLKLGHIRMDVQLLVVMVVTPLATLAMVGLGQVLNYRSGKARADEFKVDLTAQNNAIKADLTAAIRETKTDMVANMSQLRNDLTSAILRVEVSASSNEERTRTIISEQLRLELRAAMAEIRATIAEKQRTVHEERVMTAGSARRAEEEVTTR